jgi:hypothetical protein
MLTVVPARPTRTTPATSPHRVHRKLAVGKCAVDGAWRPRRAPPRPLGLVGVLPRTSVSRRDLAVRRIAMPIRVRGLPDEPRPLLMPPEMRAALPAGVTVHIMVSVITGRYRLLTALPACGPWAGLAVTLRPARPGVPLRQGGGEVGHGGGQGEQVPSEGGEGGQKLHWFRSDRWQVVRGGRSALTLPVCGRRRRRKRALPCALRPAGAGGWRPGGTPAWSARRAHAGAQHRRCDHGKDC